jgi:hypothetical protein
VRTLRILVAASLAAVALLWTLSLFTCAEISFGIVPYSYYVETERGTLTILRTYVCTEARRPRLKRLEPARDFEREFFEQWHRVSSIDSSWGVFTCLISFPLMNESLVLEPKLAVTPAYLTAIPHWLLFAPLSVLLGVTHVCARRKKSSKAPRPWRYTVKGQRPGPFLA